MFVSCHPWSRIISFQIEKAYVRMHCGRPCLLQCGCMGNSRASVLVIADSFLGSQTGCPSSGFRGVSQSRQEYAGLPPQINPLPLRFPNSSISLIIQSFDAIFFSGSSSSLGPWPLVQFRNHSSQTVGLPERVISSSQGRYLNTGQHKHRINPYTHQTSMPWVGFEPTTPVFERAKTVHALDHAATVTGHLTP
jgi:hypothetical protein